MALTTFKSMVRSSCKDRNSCGFVIQFDENSINPVSMQLQKLGACHIFTAKMHAPKYDIIIDDIWVEVEGDMEDFCFRDDLDIKPVFSEVRFSMHVVTDADNSKVKELIQEVKRHCSIGCTLTSKAASTETDIIIERLTFV